MNDTVLDPASEIKFSLPPFLLEKNPKFSEVCARVDIRQMHNQVVWLDPRRVKPIDNPRGRDNPGFSEESIADLAGAIDEVGQTTPILVCFNREGLWDAELVDGERRLLSCIYGGMMIRAHVRLDIVDREEAFSLSVAANFNRVGHTCIEIVHAIKRLQKTRTLKQIASIFGRSEQWVSQHISLLKLDESLHRFLTIPNEESDEEVSLLDQPKKRGRKVTGKLTFSLALMLTSLPSEDQIKCGNEVVKKRMPYALARRYVLSYVKEKGLEGHRRQRPPRERFESLASLVSNTENKFGVFVDMKPDELRRIFASQLPKERKALANELRMLALHMTTLADFADPPIKK